MSVEAVQSETVAERRHGPAEAHLAQLLRMLAGLEEAIIRLETRGGDTERLVARLRLVQDDIETAIKRLGPS